MKRFEWMTLINICYLKAIQIQLPFYVEENKVVAHIISTSHTSSVTNESL
jgi:hypothetical protein